MEPIFFWIIFSFVAGAIAHRKGHGFLPALFIALILSPLVGIIVALARGRNEEALENRKVKAGTHKRCPSCGELVRKKAQVCRYCRESLGRPKDTGLSSQSQKADPTRGTTPHKIVEGRCTECGCSERAIKNFGYECTPRPIAATSAQEKPEMPTPKLPMYVSFTEEFMKQHLEQEQQQKKRRRRRNK